MAFERTLVSLAALAILLPSVPAQDAPPSTSVDSAAVANSILHWVADFEDGRLAIQGSVAVRGTGGPEYLQIARKAGALKDLECLGVTTHFTLLQRLVGVAEEHPSAKVAKALLALASTGYADDMFGPHRRMVRDQGHFALLRIEDAAVWHYVHEMATEEPAKDEAADAADPVEADDEPRFEPESKAMWRVAAVRLLGMKGHGVFRSSLEKCLLRPDSRIRLAAAEGLGFLRHRDSLAWVGRALAGERHPMVALALAEALHRILKQHENKLTTEKISQAVRSTVRLLGRGSWRVDVAIVRIVRDYPVKEAVPELIRLMRLSRGEVDPILKIINKNASRYVGLEAFQTLRKITGAIVPDDPDLWQKFWDKEKDRLEVTPRRKEAEQYTVASSKAGTFYGIPVLGSDVVFIIDTSGSMKTPVTKDAATTAARSKKTSGKGKSSRLSAAKRQTLNAVQGMQERARYSLVTFSTSVRRWNRKPVEARKSNRRTIASILGRLQPKGSTNLFGALELVLESKSVGYGVKAKTEVDEVFILSDGLPSAGDLVNPEDILETVREINKLRRVRINTVFTGTGSGADFMRRLAEENNGVFVQR